MRGIARIIDLAGRRADSRIVGRICPRMSRGGVESSLIIATTADGVQADAG